MIRLRRSCSGQASAEYVAVVLAVALLLAAAVTAAIALNPPFGRQVTATVRQGICIVWADVCTDADARAAGFAPCPIDIRRDEERVGVEVGIVKVGHGNAVLVQRRSDGSVAVSSIDRTDGRGQVKAGVRATPIGVNLGASADAGVAFAAGRTWEFRNRADAEAFVRRYAARRSLKAKQHAIERWAGLRGGDDGPPLPPADVHYLEGGPIGTLSAGLFAGSPGGERPAPDADGAADGAPGETKTTKRRGVTLPGADAGARGMTVLGRSRRGARTTWYVRVDAQVAGHLGGVVGELAAGGQGEAVLEVSFEGDRPVELRASGTAAGDAALDLGSGGSSLADVGGQLRAARRLGSSGAIEADVALDLRDPANLAAAAGLLRSGASPAAWRGDLRALAARLDADGVANVRVYSLEQERGGGEFGIALGGALGGEYTTLQDSRRFTRGWSLASGGDFREREDCAEAARPDAVPA